MQNNSASNVATFTKPLHGFANGQPCRIIATGDVEGHSPSYLTVDGQGNSQWTSFKDVQIIDFDYLPLADATLQGLANVTTRRGQAVR